MSRGAESLDESGLAPYARAPDEAAAGSAALFIGASRAARPDFTKDDPMKRTFQPSNLVRARRHGFFARKATPGGRKVLRLRRRRGRKTLCA